MSLNWPTNTATPPSGWERMTDADGTCPIGWFTRAEHGMRIVVRAYPTWDDAPWEIPAEYRTPVTAEDLDHDETDIWLSTMFDLAYRGYIFPDVDTATAPNTHGFVNLDFCGGWQAPMGTNHEAQEVFLERTLAGLKPASDLMPTPSERERFAAAAHKSGLNTVLYDMGGRPRLWVTPARLADRVDEHALTAAWHTLIEADPDQQRREWVRVVVDEALATAFGLDLLQPFVERDRSRMLPPWWDEETDEGLVVLGSVLGYPPASTYSLLVETYGPYPLPFPPVPADSTLLDVQRTTPPATIVTVTMDETDFEQLSETSTQWCHPGGRNDLISQADRFETRPGDHGINWKFRYAYWVGDQWSHVLFARAYLDAVGQPYQVLFDVVENPDFSWVILTDYASPVWLGHAALSETAHAGPSAPVTP